MLRIERCAIVETKENFVIPNAVRNQVGRDAVVLEHGSGRATFVAVLRHFTTAT